MPDEEHKPCPFCNSSNLREDTMYYDDDGESQGIECLDCDASARVEWWDKRV